MEHSSIKQLKYYPAETAFTIKAICPASGEVKVRKDSLIADYACNISYLKYLNFTGYNIYFFPAQRGVVDILLDDINRGTIKQLNIDGLNPLYILETSPFNFQVVIRLSENYPISMGVKTLISMQLCDLYGADRNSADVSHFFRLAGYTNRKEKYCKNNLYPYIRLYPGNGVAVKGQQYLENVEAGIKNGYIEISKDNNCTTPQPELIKNRKPGCDVYVKKVYNSNNIQDLSALDFKVAVYSLRKGFSQADISTAIHQYSPSLEVRKAGHVQDYIKRTIQNAALSLHNINIL